MGQSALGFALCKLQTADVSQMSFVLAHLLVDDQLHTPIEHKMEMKTKEQPFQVVTISKYY